MLDFVEEQVVAEQFGVALPQVRRDHLISHLLGAISAHLADDVLFFGGTALSRTLGVAESHRRFRGGGRAGTRLRR